MFRSFLCVIPLKKRRVFFCYARVLVNVASHGGTRLIRYTPATQHQRGAPLAQVMQAREMQLCKREEKRDGVLVIPQDRSVNDYRDTLCNAPGASYCMYCYMRRVTQNERIRELIRIFLPHARYRLRFSSFALPHVLAYLLTFSLFSFHYFYISLHFLQLNGCSFSYSRRAISDPFF